MIILFPIDRQRAELRRCARNLLTLHGERANVYWRREMQALAARMRRCGAEDAEICRQALALTAAVQNELVRLHYTRDAAEAFDEGA